MRRTSWTAMIVAFIVFVVVCSYFISEPRREVTRFITEAAAVQVHTTTLGEFRNRLEQAHFRGAHEAEIEGMRHVSFAKENTLLYRLHLAPRTVIGATVSFEGGTASEIYLRVEVVHRGEYGPRPEGPGAVVSESTDSGKCRQHYDVEVKKRYGVGDRYWVTVGMDPCVSPQDRAKAFAVNTGCLTKIGGCKTVEDLLPAVFSSR